MLAEAVGLVNTLDNWTVVDTIILSTKTPEKKRIFGKGNFQSLTGITYWRNSPGFDEPEEYLSVPLLSSMLEKIRQTAGITAVFVNVEHLSPLSEVSFCDICPLTASTRGLCTNPPCFHVQRELEEAWGVKVFDRYSVVLHIFRCNAHTKEAKLQIALAEIPLLR